MMDESREKHRSDCAGCGRPYGDEYGFPDLIIPTYIWVKISPTGDTCGGLCPSCICQRLHEQGIRCEGAFMSGPIISVTSATMEALRRIENLEQALEGSDSYWGQLFDQRAQRATKKIDE